MARDISFNNVNKKYWWLINANNNKLKNNYLCSLVAPWIVTVFCSLWLVEPLASIIFQTQWNHYCKSRFHTQRNVICTVHTEWMHHDPTQPFWAHTTIVLHWWLKQFQELFFQNMAQSDFSLISLCEWFLTNYCTEQIWHAHKDNLFISIQRNLKLEKGTMRSW